MKIKLFKKLHGEYTADFEARVNDFMATGSGRAIHTVAVFYKDSQKQTN